MYEGKSDGDKGYIFVQVETYGFDDDVFIMAQPKNNFINHATNANSLTKVYRSNWGYKFDLPAERDVLVSFTPKSRATREFSTTGKLILRTKWIKKPEQKSIDDVLYTIVATRPTNDPVIKIPERQEIKPVFPIIDQNQIEEEKKKEEQKQKEMEEQQKNEQEEGDVVIDENVEKPDQTDFEQEDYNKTDKVNWEGDKIPDGPWFEKELFMVGGMKVTNKHAVVGGSTVLIIILVVVGVCCIISYYKRKEIAEGGRRLSVAIRQSISGRGSEAPPDPNEKPPDVN